MLFLVKRSSIASLVLLGAFASIALLIRSQFSVGPSLGASWENVGKGVIVVSLVIVSDGVIYGLLWLFCGKWYLTRHQDLMATVRDQSILAILCGSLLAGIGEELVFRGLSQRLEVLLPLAVIFGLLHHVRRKLTIITLWSVWQGILFALALYWTQSLLVTMVAHFLHDFCGYIAFRFFNRGIITMPFTTR